MVIGLQANNESPWELGTPAKAASINGIIHMYMAAPRTEHSKRRVLQRTLRF